MANQCFDQKQESLEPEQEPSDKNELFHWILTLAIAVIIALCVNRFVLVNAEIPSGSMENTIPGKPLQSLYNNIINQH